MKNINSLFYLAARRTAKANPKKLKSLINESKELIENLLTGHDEDGNTALHYTSYHKESMQMLIDKNTQKKPKTCSQ